MVRNNMRATGRPRTPLGEKMWEFRGRFHLSREAAAKALGIAYATVYTFETGIDSKTHAPSTPRESTLLHVSRAMARYALENGNPYPHGEDGIFRDLMTAAGLMSPGSSAKTQPREEEASGLKTWTSHDLQPSTRERGAQYAGLRRNEDLQKDIAKRAQELVQPSQGVEFVPLENFRRVPVFPVACGEPMYITEHPDEWIFLPDVMAGSVDAALRVRGNSMLGVGYKEGDLLTVKLLNGERPLPGRKVIAEIDGAVTCKIYQVNDGVEMLVSAPGEEKPTVTIIKPGMRLVGEVLWKHSKETP